MLPCRVREPGKMGKRDGKMSVPASMSLQPCEERAAHPLCCHSPSSQKKGLTNTQTQRQLEEEHYLDHEQKKIKHKKKIKKKK